MAFRGKPRLQGSPRTRPKGVQHRRLAHQLAALLPPPRRAAQPREVLTNAEDMYRDLRHGNHRWTPADGRLDARIQLRRPVARASAGQNKRVHRLVALIDLSSGPR